MSPASPAPVEDDTNGPIATFTSGPHATPPADVRDAQQLDRHHDKMPPEEAGNGDIMSTVLQSSNPDRHDPSPADAVSVTPVNKAVERSPRKPVAKSGRKNSPSSMKSVTAARRQQAGPATNANRALHEEISALDEEITRLRGQLAEKLYLQNLQLKRMLERFDAS
ncbi:hypothetical protein [Rhizobium ecuadorense]|uniref:hypothetical protein n=1 Tax=Rhizobium ecuadorense TaxID=1671795 RepID=UPI00128F1E2C|nr:hypothetical protein [Rhizobium ecuadorense]